MPKQTNRRIIDSQNSAIIRQLQARVSVAGSYVLLDDYEDADVLAKLLNVDGAGSGLDADLLDGKQAVAFLWTDGSKTGATVGAQTFTLGVVDSTLTATRLLASNGSRQLASVADLASWIAGTANQVTVTNDGDGTVTLSLPQNLHSAATPTFAGLTDSSLTATRLLASDGSKRHVSVANLASWIAGTANQITVTDDADGTITLSLPQNIHTAATPTFAGLIAAYLKPAADSTTALQFQKSGGAIVVNIDTTNSRVGIGAPAVAPSQALDVRGNIVAISETITSFAAVSYHNDSGPTFAVRHARGTLSAPTAILANYGLGSFNFGGLDSGGALRDRLTIAGYAAENWGSAANLGTYLTISTTTIGAASATEKLRLSDAGNIGLGQTTFGTSAVKVLAIGNGTAPSSSPADAVQLYSLDYAAGDAGLHLRTESGAVYKFASVAILPGDVYLADAKNIVLDTTTGTKIGTSTSQKLSFFNATPIAQRSHVADPSGGATTDAEARTAINAILATLEAYGFHATS